MTRLPRPGDRIRLISMHDDPAPIDAGQTGSVVMVSSFGQGNQRWHQIDVSWDNGRSLMLVSPPDTFEIISGDK
ncbi:MAG: DUF4314 domain-containing protein [Planctomycetales bacterium]|nr:DUF4314 domain-containing protein [Planctomycetales bacterium]MCA9225548.1 DUF4314 domain-containing protein [Planctomycetales bacterium]